MFTVLSVEDNDDHAELIRLCLSNEKNLMLVRVETAESALDYLRKSQTESNVPTPNLILLDLNLPKMSGLELLKLLKTKCPLKAVPTVILSTSDASEDIKQAKIHGADDYLVKATTLQKLKQDLLNCFKKWSLAVAAKPHHSPS